MDEQKNNPFLREQNKTKPNIEDVIPYFLDGDNRKNALALITYLRECKINPVWAIYNGWKATYKGKVLFYIRLPKYEDNNHKKMHFRNMKHETEWMHSWVFTPYLHNIDKYEEKIIHEGLQELIWDNIHYCMPCEHRKCPEHNKVVLGKELKNLCYGHLYGGCAVWFVNPNESIISDIKNLLKMEIQARA